MDGLLKIELTALCFICTMDAEQKAYLKTIYYDPSHPASYSGCGESDSENAPIITQSREDAEVRQICKRRAGQRGNWTVEFIL